MGERDLPAWASARTTNQDKMTRLFRTRQSGKVYGSGASTTGSNSKSVSGRKNSNSEQLPLTNESQDVTTSSSTSMPRWMKSWVLWTFLLALIPGGIGFVSVAMLLKLPTAPNCPSIFWPLASASVRLHCSDLAASKHTVKDLLQAIDLVKHLPQNHPLRAEIDRNIHDWSREILELADESFQAGRLEEAIEIARKIPQDVVASNLVEKQISQWESVEAQGQSIYKEVEGEMREQRWHPAFMTASKLLRLDSKYWATTKYNDLNELIVSAREDGETLAIAQGLAESNNVEKILKAIKLASTIKEKSYVYGKAQEAIPEFGQRMLDLAEKRLDNRDADQAIYIAQKIPAVTGLQLVTEDFITIADAQRNAWSGTVFGLETAIASAGQIDSSRPVYNKAQKLIALWQVEIEDVARLEQARTLASQGTVGDLTAAINEARLIPSDNPRGQEAKREISRWAVEIQNVEDRPYLDSAEQLAMLGDFNSLQAAIVEASRIGRGRSLYKEARNKIATWNRKIQRIEDQPYLDQARMLARNGNISGAIQTAQQISSGRALSSEAQSDIGEWREQLSARDNWKQAREVALQGTPNALSEAIRLARRVPRSSMLSGDASVAIDQWSDQLLDMARSQAASNMTQGIETAKLIPQGTSAYRSARQDIRTWREFLNPPEPEPVQPVELPPIKPPRIIQQQQRNVEQGVINNQ